MNISRTFAIQLLAVALFVPSAWLYVHAGSDLFGDRIDLGALLDSRRYWLAFAAPYVWLGHAAIILVAIARPFIELGRGGPDRHETANHRD